MLTDREVYRWLDGRIPASVDRTSALNDLDADEDEEAVMSLVAEAFEEGELSLEIVETLKREYPESGYPLESIEWYERQIIENSFEK
ncbi:hypothetical protein CAURIC_08085 [Corynebacterium auriscanis]|uniref:Uncharacterized protein n=2 Tax=Corynebacterium auriscanis TaxID=99807 RepID=A0A0A2DMM0_9CORY|nr:hypothetical protein MA47_09710 [Corynebacterium auriscanis]WJY73230.1 hypothetical protein CAURIC_08085 [Corynebacterium auriscanis]